MLFTPDVEDSLRAAAELVNADDSFFSSTDAMSEFMRAWRYSGQYPRTRAEVARVGQIRPQLRELLTADRDEAVALVNEILAEQRALPQLVRHDDIDWHIHAIDGDRPLHERVLVETAMAMIDLIRAGEMSRLGTCAAADCDDLVVDFSRNRSRKFCSTTCGNREAQAAYRARQG